MNQANKTHHNLEELAHYSRGQRVLDISSVMVFLLLSALIAREAALHLADNRAGLWVVALAFTVGLLGADFVSGFVHWMADTWGSKDLPFIGPALVRPFREHHVDPEAITRHDFFETNGNNCLVSLLVLVPLAFLDVRDLMTLFVSSFCLSLTLWVFLTNQFHKWAHTPRPHPVVRWLQKRNLILGKTHHAIHHAPPYTKYYNITNGWLNEPLVRIGFYPALERIVTRLTGMIPREDDIGKEAALTVAQQAGVIEAARARSIPEKV
jgi:ubiquitin-conjugating enzyme E2 variant